MVNIQVWINQSKSAAAAIMTLFILFADGAERKVGLCKKGRIRCRKGDGWCMVPYQFRPAATTTSTTTTAYDQDNCNSGPPLTLLSRQQGRPLHLNVFMWAFCFLTISITRHLSLFVLLDFSAIFGWPRVTSLSLPTTLKALAERAHHFHIILMCTIHVLDKHSFFS